MRVLIAEDDYALGSLLQRTMENDGHTVTWVQDGESALATWQTAQFRFLLLDLNLPRKDGREVLQAIRQVSDAAVMVLTARNSLEERLRCLELGADDFLPKPFALRELQMRCRAMVRRLDSGVGSQLRCGDLVLDRNRRAVQRGGRSIDLTMKEYSLLEYLLEHRGECVSRSGLLEHVWKMHPDVTTNVVDVYINYLRRKVDEGADRKLIHTVRGNGYVMRVPSLGSA
ncbi:MAG TPA: response regulator transcription factor [Acidobacteriaceae bacterium]|nr:response regulator transcription factor [Acidobacteriaceae bacterium]